MDPATYLASERERLLSELAEFLRIPSISGLSSHRDDMTRAARWLADRTLAAGFERAAVVPTAGHPIVFAEWNGAPGAPTALVYGHYDVQPADPLDRWTTPPFEPDFRSGAVYARGASDDKGQVFLHVAAAEALLRTSGTLPVNLRLLVEGEEEVSSPSLVPYLETHRSEAAADVAVVSDTPMLAPGTPTICTSLRGLCDCEFSVRTARTDLHSGQYGGGVANALHVLAALLAGLHDARGRVAVAGFYDDVAERRAEIDLDDEALCRETGALLPWGEAGRTTADRLWHRPTLEVNGAWGGFTGEGPKTVIPCEAHAKVTARLVPGQDPAATLRLIERHLREHCPPTAELTFVARGHAKPAAIDRDHPAVQAAARALKTVFGRDASLVGEGGSIPVVSALADHLGLETVLLGFGLPGDNLHAPDEHFHLECFDLGVRTLCAFWPELARTFSGGWARRGEAGGRAPSNRPRT